MNYFSDVDNYKVLNYRNNNFNGNIKKKKKIQKWISTNFFFQGFPLFFMSKKPKKRGP